MFSVVAVIALLCAVEVEALTRRQNLNWDFALYVERWPGTLTQDRLPKNVSTFTLHGMWPERNDNTWPQFCSSSTFDPRKISSIIGEMDTYWPNLQSHGTSDSFWKHEWEKHGTCAADGTMAGISDELSFFQFALDIHSSMPYAAALASNGIVPSDSNTYTLSQINNALTSTFNFTVIPSCMKSNGQINLMRLYSCISKQGYLINCPNKVIQGLNQRNDCGNGQSIGMPPIQH